MVSRQLRQEIAAQAQHRCGYCQTQEVVSGVPLTIEHLIPRALGGSDDIHNLWLSCRLCNEAKGIQIEGVDPESDATAPLFNPRTQQWDEHFAWDEDKTHIRGRTPVGQATVAALDLNTALRVQSRALWVEAGYHPPRD